MDVVMWGLFCEAACSRGCCGVYLCRLHRPQSQKKILSVSMLLKKCEHTLCICSNKLLKSDTVVKGK